MQNIVSLIYISPKKGLIKHGVLLCILFTVLYLFFLGSIMRHISIKKELSDILEQESQQLYTLEERAAQKDNNPNSDYFLGLGYAENQKFEILKTKRNVATVLSPLY